MMVIVTDAFKFFGQVTKVTNYSWRVNTLLVEVSKPTPVYSKNQTIFKLRKKFICLIPKIRNLRYPIAQKIIYVLLQEYYCFSQTISCRANFTYVVNTEETIELQKFLDLIAIENNL